MDHVVKGLDESKGAMAMVTEPIFASVANTLGKFDNVTKVLKDLKGLVRLWLLIIRSVKKLLEIM